MRLSEWLSAAQRRLAENGVEAARLEAEVLAAHVLMVDRTWIVAHPEADIPELPAENVLQRRLNHEPLAYILGHREFYGREFSVGPGVLIPRQETETLIEAAVEMGGDHLKVLDIGTGSGCIAITLALEKPDWKVFGSDISAKALDIARRNAENLKAHVTFIHGDGAAGIQESNFDMIVSNPPYVSRKDQLAPEIRDFEPDVALYAEDDGLDFYRRLSTEVPRILRPEGSILLELGAGQLESVRTIFEQHAWKFGESWKDLLGVERVASFRPLHMNK